MGERAASRCDCGASERRPELSMRVEATSTDEAVECEQGTSESSQSCGLQCGKVEVLVVVG